MTRLVLVLAAGCAALVSAAHAADERIPLSQFLPDPGPIELRRADAAANLYLPLAGRVVVKSAALGLQIVGSHALVPVRSLLRVSANGTVIGQFPLDPRQASIAAEVDLPPDRLKTGFNELTLAASQHYTSSECEDERAPELWTQIDAANSYIRVDYQRDLRNLRLSDLPQLINPGIGGSRQINLLGAGEPTPERLGWAVLAAEAMGIRLDYVPAVLTHGVARPGAAPAASGARLPLLDQSGLAGHDQILIGTRAELEPVLGAPLAPQISDAYLAILPLDADPQHFILIVSGTTGAEVARAARALSFLDYTFADAPSALIKEVDVPAGLAPSGRVNVRPNAMYRLADLGFATRTIRGDKIDFRFTVPPDLYTGETVKSEFDLHFAYGAGLRGDSVLQIYLNGNFETSIHLDQVDGAELRGYAVQIPVRSLLPGGNLISFVPIMMPLSSGQCVLRNNDNAQFTLFEDSRLVMPPTDRLALEPDLALFGRTGFPYTNPLLGDSLTLAVTAKDDATIGAALTLAAKLAQLKGALIDMAVTLGEVPGDRNAIAIGPAAALPPVLVAAAPVGLGAEKRVPAERLAVAASEPPPSLAANWIARLRGLLGLPGPVLARNADATVQRIVQVSSLGRNAVMTAFKMPGATRHVAMLVTALDAASLEAATRRLVTPQYWSQLKGDLVIWRDAPETVTASAVGPQFSMDNLGPYTRAGWLASEHPGLWIGGIAALVFLFAAFTAMLVRRKIRRRNGGA